MHSRAIEIHSRIDMRVSRSADSVNEPDEPTVRRDPAAALGELEQQAGAMRENVSRALKRMERRGAIACRRGRIELLDL